MVELNFDIVENEQLLLWVLFKNEKVIVGNGPQEIVLRFFGLLVIVKNEALANDREVGNKAALFEIGDRYHSYFENLVYLFSLLFQRQGRLQRLLFAPFEFDVVLEVINVPNLARDCDPMALA